MENLFGIGILLDYQDRASAKMLKTQRVFSQTQQTAEQLAEAVEKNNEKFNKLAGMSAGVAMAGVGLQMSGNKVLGVLREAVEESKTFELELADLGIILGATSEEMALLEKRALETGMATMFSPQETVQGMQALAAAGMDLDQVLGSLNHALDLVAMSGGAISLEEGAGVLASTLNKFNLDVSQAERVADMFAHIANLTNFGVEDMSAFINSLGTAPTKIGRTLEEMLAMGGMLSNIGQQSAQAGATVQGFGRQLIMITQQLERGKGMKVDVLKELGLDEQSFWDAEGKMLSMVEVFQNITEATAGLTDMERATALQRLFGDQAGNMINAVEGASRAYLVLDEATGKYIETSAEGKTTFEDVVKGLSDIGGTARASAKMMEETFWGVEKIKEGVQQTFRVLLGQTVMPILNKFYQGLSGILEKIVNFGYEHPKFMKALGYGIGLAGLLLTAVGMALMLAGAIGGVIAGIGILAGKIATLATTWLGLNASMISGSAIASALWLKMRPLATQAGALSLTLGALYLAWKSDFGGIKTIITDFIKRTGQAFSDAKRIIGMNTDDMLSAVRKLGQNDDFFSKLTVGLVKLDTLWKGLTEAWSDYTLSEETFVKLRELGLLPLIEKILDAKMKFDAFFEGIKIGFGIVSEVVQTVVTTIGEWIGKAIGFIRDLISPTREVKDEIDEVNEVTDALNLDVWRNFGVAIGILGGAFVTYKIASMVWDIVSAVGRLGKVIVVDLVPSIFKFIGGLSKKIALMAVDKAETLYLIGLYAKEGIAKGLLTAKTWLLTGATKALGVAQGVVNALFVASPIGWIILGIVALVGVIYLLIKHWDKVKEKTLEVWGMITEKIGSAKDKIVEIMGNMKDGIVNAWESVKERIGTVVEGIKTFVTERIPEIITNIVEWFKELPNKIGYALGFIVGRIARWVVDTVELVRTRVPEIVETVVNFFRELPGKIYERISETYTKITEWASNMLTIATEKVSEIVEAVRLFFSELPGKIYGAISGAYERVVGWASNMIATVREQVPIIINRVVKFFSELPGKIYDKISEVIGKVIQWKDDVIGTIKTEVPKIISKVVEFFKELPGKLLKIGRDIVTGLWDGIWGKVDWLKGKVGTFVRKVVQGFEDGFETKSPSRVMELEIGQWLPAGLAKGIEGNKGILDKTVISHMIEPVVNPVKGIVEYISNVDVPTIKPLRGLIEYETNEPTFKPLNKSENISETPKELSMHKEYVGKTEDNSVTFEEGAIQITVEKGTEEDAERFAEMIMKKIEKKKQLQRTMNYGIQPV
jgi:TP901 family phage tail tape measure protein